MPEQIDTHDDHQRDHHSDHHSGLAHDLRVLLARRRVLRGLGSVGAGAALAYVGLGGPGQAQGNVIGTAADGSTCVLDPTETAGPFPGDGTNVRDGQTVNVLTQTGVVRQDIRTSFAGMTPVADGVQLDLTLGLVNVKDACAPLAGHAIYIWHCDAAGLYSLYATDDSNYLRGVQVTDAAGQVRFTTVFPACYDGRWPHIHFEVFASPAAAVSGEAALLTSQFAFAADICATLFAADPRYAQSLRNLSRVSLEGDMVFRDNTAEQVMAQTLAVTGDPASGYVATAKVGVAL